tara:strand:+ start:572 stop:913 length:342 start_codon:yes stop_codon:yes gene_type:complete
MNFLIKSVLALVPDAQFISNNEKILQWHDTRPQPTQEEIDKKIAELEAAEPMRLLRIERNQKLAETDWMALNDVAVSAEWKTYRQALRDLPATAEPKLENGMLTNITWPEVPE